MAAAALADKTARIACAMLRNATDCGADPVTCRGAEPNGRERVYTATQRSPVLTIAKQTERQ
jgi:hypothetical protein